MVLKQSNRGDPSSAGVQAALRVFQRDTSQGQQRHRHIGVVRSPASLPQKLQSLRARSPIFFEHGTEYRKVGAVRFSQRHFLERMNRCAYDGGRLSGTIPYHAGFAGRNIVSGKMYSVSAAGQSNIGA